MSKSRKLGNVILTVTILNVVGFFVVGWWDDSVSGRGTFFAVLVTLVLGLGAYAISTSFDNK